VDAHVAFVGVLFIIWGLLTALVGVSTLALGIGAVALLSSAAGRGGGGQVAAGVTAIAFTTLAIIAIVWGMAHVLVGVPLRQREAADVVARLDDAAAEASARLLGDRRVATAKPKPRRARAAAKTASKRGARR